MISVSSYYLFEGLKGSDFFVLFIVLILGVSGILSDVYSATLRTWFFSVSSASLKATLYGIFFGVLIIPLVLNLNLVHGLLIGTISGVLIGELRSPAKKSFSKLLKSSLGTTIGLFGMATKTIVGIQMIDIFIKFSGFTESVKPILQTYI